MSTKTTIYTFLFAIFFKYSYMESNESPLNAKNILISMS